MRRGNGEGSIYREADGRWCAVVSLPTGGRRKFHARSREEAAGRLLAARRLVADGLPLPDERRTVGDFITSWLTDTARCTVRSSTYQSYETIVRVHLIPTLGHVRLARLTPQQVQRVLNEKSASGLSPRRVDYIRAVLRRALGQAVRWGMIGRNVATLVEPPRARHAKVQPFSPEEARQFLDAMRGDRLEALYAVALAVGLRQGEALGLRWVDVDLAELTITVRHALQRVNGVLQLVEPKTDRSHRIIPLPQTVADRMVEHKERQAIDRDRASNLWVESGFVFTTVLGKPLDGSSVTHRFQKALATAGLRRQRFHDLRHGCASLLLAQGVPARVVMEILGHSNITLTLNTYSHVMPRIQRAAIGGMEDLFGQQLAANPDREGSTRERGNGPGAGEA